MKAYNESKKVIKEVEEKRFILDMDEAEVRRLITFLGNFSNYDWIDKCGDDINELLKGDNPNIWTDAETTSFYWKLLDSLIKN